MTTWVSISNAEIANGQVVTNSMMLRYRDNLRALAEDDASVPAADTIKRMGRQNRVVVGAAADDGSRQLQVYGADANGWCIIISDGASIGTLIGKRGGVAAIGTVGASALGLNPDGGAVIIGTDPGVGNELLRVGGNARFYFADGTNAQVRIANSTNQTGFQMFGTGTYINLNENAAEHGSLTVRSSNAYTARLEVLEDGTIILGGTDISGSGLLRVNGNVALASVLSFHAAATVKQVNAYAGGDLELVTRTAGDRVRIYTANGILAATFDAAQNLETVGNVRPKGVGYVWPAAGAFGTLLNDGVNNLSWSEDMLLFGDRNVIINGGFEVWQRGSADVAAIATLTFHPDRWRYFKFGSVVHTSKRSTTVPGASVSGVMSRYSWNLSCTTGAAPAAADFCHVSQSLEGNKFRGIYFARTCTLSFWVRASKTGNLPVTLRTNSAANSCVKRVTINAANTWERKTVTFPAGIQSGVNPDENTAMTLHFGLHIGSNFQTSIANDGVWISGSALGFTTGDTNFALNASDEFFIALVQLEPGSVATPYQFRPFDMELFQCQRYFWKTMPYGIAAVQNCGSTFGAITYRANVAGVSAANSVRVAYPRTMRFSPPVITFMNPNAANALWRNITDNADSGAATAIGATAESFTAGNAQVATDGVGETLAIHAVCDADG